MSCLARVRNFELSLDPDAEVEGVVQPGRRLGVHVVGRHEDGKEDINPRVTLVQGDDAITLTLRDWSDVLTWLDDHIMPGAREERHVN